MEQEDFIILIIIFGIVAKRFIYDLVIVEIDQVQLFLGDLIHSYSFYLIFELLSVITFISFIFIIYRKLSEKLEIRKKEKGRMEKTISEAKRIVENKSNNHNPKEIANQINQIKKIKENIASIKNTEGLQSQLTYKLIEEKRKLILSEYIDEIRDLEDKRYSIEEEITKLDHKKHLKQLLSEEKRRYALRKLEADKYYVFKKSGLNKEQIRSLCKDGFKQRNEYCVYERKVITVLVRPPLNHSITHTFLVWSVIRLLNNIKEIINIKEHETRNADITFNYKGKKFALEIETGSLLRKK